MSEPLGILVSASGAPGTARLLRALRENGEREVRLVGTDMGERAVGKHLCDAFHRVPAGSDPSFPDAVRELVGRERVDVVLPQSSFDLAGLAMYFVTLDDPELMETADRIVDALEIEWFLNIQLVGDLVIEVNPRISTVVYQEDLNLPYLGVKRALGEISDDELESLRAQVRPGRTALRYFDQLEWN